MLSPRRLVQMINSTHLIESVYLRLEQVVFVEGGL